MSLLIVDDDKPFQQRLARAMEKRGFSTETADGVQDAAVKILRTRRLPMRLWTCAWKTETASM